MSCRILALAFGILSFLVWTPLQRAASLEPAAVSPTPAPAGPFHVSGNQILDSKGRPFLIRGTQVAPFHPETAAHDNRARADFSTGKDDRIMQSRVGGDVGFRFDK